MGVVVGGLALAAPGASATTYSLPISGPSRITYGSSALVSTRLEADGVPVAHAVVKLLGQPLPSGTPQDVGTTTTDATGAASMLVTPHHNVAYSWAYVIFDTPTAVAIFRGPSMAIGVAQRVSVAATAGGSTKQPITLFGTVTPNEAGKYVQLEYRRSATSSWAFAGVRAVLKSQLLPNGLTKLGYVLSFNLPYPAYRVYRAATATNAAGASARVLVVVSK